MTAHGDNRPIGIFDSGVGGLTVCREVQKLLPGENIIYFGDTARSPYGTRSVDTLIRYSREITEYFLSKDVKMIVCACNTASAAALPVIEKEYKLPMLGVIQAGARAACNYSENKKIGVIGTRATVNSEAYIKAVKAICHDCDILQQQATVLVTLVEEGWTDNEIAELSAKQYIDPLYNEGIRTLILGCTHFPVLKNTLSKIYPEINLIDTGREIALEVESILKEKNLENLQQNGSIELYTSDITDTIRRMKKMFFGGNGVKLEKLVINGKQ